MSELSKKILASGLVDDATASLMERWGIIDSAEADLAKAAKIHEAGREELIKFAESIEGELEKNRKLRETMLDLNHLRWPAKLVLAGPDGVPSRLSALIDRMGRYYFRAQDVNVKWFVPGYTITRDNQAPETVLEVTELYVGDQVAAIQVSTQEK